jgi:signal transduction histidine kinase
VAIAVVLFYVPFVVHHWYQFSVDNFSRVMETLVFIVVASLLGHLVEKERRRHKALLRAKNLAAMGRAVAEVAHDMKTPLVAIGGLARSLAKHLKNEEQANQDKLDVIVREADRLETMIREMLDFGKDLEIHPAPTDLNKLVEESVNLANSMAEKAGVELRLETDVNLGELSLDGFRIRQVLLNLVSNGIEACAPISKVTVRTESSKDYALLRVSDEGCGVNPEDREKIFNPFYSKKKKGTGLGLAIVKKIVDAHGANIDVTDNVPRGTTITIAFPRQQKCSQNGQIFTA